MFDRIKYGISNFIIKKKLKHNRVDRQSFKDFFKNSFLFLILMPEGEKEFHYAVEMLKWYEEQGKSIKIFTHDFRVSLLPAKYHSEVIDYNLKDVNRFYLPAKNLEAKLNGLEFDAVLDLNKEESLFNSLAANLVKARVRVGFRKKNSDMYYNLQVVNSDNNPEMFYKNFLNCLQMF